MIDSEGKRLLSRRVANDEADLLELISQVLGMAEETTWAVDMITGGAALLLALLVAHGQQVLYISSTMVNRASDGYRGQGKTDARDAAVIADQARMRRGLTPLRVDEELIVELRMLVARRQDLVADRTRDGQPTPRAALDPVPRTGTRSGRDQQGATDTADPSPAPRPDPRTGLRPG